MKNIMSLTATIAAALVLFLGCQSGASLSPVTDEEVTMETIDNLMERPGAKYVDLRNVGDKYSGGYIDGFEFVSFFEYLDGYALVRNNGWEFSDADIEKKLVLENIFGAKDREVFLMCGSGTRAGYTQAALESIGYTKVYNAGGIRDYNGENKVLGDNERSLILALPRIDSDEDVTMASIDDFLDRPGAKYVDLRNVADKYTGGYIDGFEFVSFFEYLENNALTRNNGWEFSDADVTRKAVLENIFGAKDREVFLMCGSGTRAGYTKAALESIGYTTVYNAGGIRDYNGENKILGDSTFQLALQ